MSKGKINMVGGGFQHDICSSAGSIPQKMEWIKGDHTASESIHIDAAIKGTPTNKNKKNYGWLAESKTINKGLYEWCVNNIEYLEDNFELIFTHDKSLLPISNKFKMVICNARPWVKDYGIHQKNKLISMVASNKVMCEDHKYRQKIISKYKNKLDLFGRGYKTIPTKDVGIKDYMFSVAMENGTYPLMYTEKITDCFAMGTIPIYYGTEFIGEVFDTNGIIKLTDDLNLESLTSEIYYSKIDSIKNNYEITMNIPTVEDYIYEKYLK